MTMQKTATLTLAALVAATWGGAALYAQEHERVNSPGAVHEQSAKHLGEVI